MKEIKLTSSSVLCFFTSFII